jgi:ABC-type transporter Mla MlaB component
VIDRLVLPDRLDYTTRLDFTTNASRVIEHAHAEIEVDCSAIAVVDDSTVGMLVWLTRNARRRGLPVVLDNAPARLLAALEVAGVSDRFQPRSNVVTPERDAG